MGSTIDRKKLAKVLISLVLFIFIVNFFATKFFLYHSIWYFDMPMHFLGGLWSGLFLIWILSFKNLPSASHFGLIFKIIFGVLLIGISWEVFEFSANNFLARDFFLANVLDSVSDIFFDLAGGLVAILYYLKKIMPREENGVQLQ